MIRDPQQTPPWQGGGTAGCVDVGQVREGFRPSGMEAASAPLDETACNLFPLRGKDVTTSTHTHPQLCTVSACVRVASAAQHSAV